MHHTHRDTMKKKKKINLSSSTFLINQKTASITTTKECHNNNNNDKGSAVCQASPSSQPSYPKDTKHTVYCVIPDFDHVSANLAKWEGESR